MTGRTAHALTRLQRANIEQRCVGIGRRVDTSRKCACAIFVQKAILQLGRLAAGERRIHIRDSDEFSAETSNIYGLDRSVSVELILESVIEIFRVGSTEMGVGHEGERSLWCEELTRAPLRCEWKRVDEPNCRKRVGENVRGGSQIRRCEVCVRNTAEWRLASEL